MRDRIDYRGKPRTLYLIRRGPDFAKGYHASLVPDSAHRVIVCTRKHTARWEAGWTGDGATMWERPATDDGCGFLLIRWQGFDIDYWHLVRGGECPDGMPMGFCHPGNPEPAHRAVWDFLNGAIWWSSHFPPEWLIKRGVKVPTDQFTIDRIIADDGTCLLSESQQEKLEDARHA